MGVGRRPKTTAEKVLAGNPGKRPLNEREPTAPVRAPSCPKWLTGAARTEFRRAAKLLVAMRVLTEADRAGLAAYAVTWGRWQEAEEKVSDLGAIVTTKNGNYIQNPYLSIANRAMDDMRKFAVEFGLTPSSRSRVKRAEEEKPELTPAEALFAKVHERLTEDRELAEMRATDDGSVGDWPER